MRVAFLALGATRRRAVVEESAEVVAEGGAAMVVVDRAQGWDPEGFAPGVTVVELSRLKARHAPVRLERLFLYRGPRFLLYRVIGRGPLRGLAHRAATAYQRRVADRIHRRLFLPVYRRLWPEVTPRLVERQVLRRTGTRTLVVTDPMSIPAAAGILRRYRVRGQAPPAVCYSIDHLVGTASATRVGSPSPRDRGETDGNPA